MPEKCQYCGEEAVIEDSIDGCRDHKICVECGSLATEVSGLTKSSHSTGDEFEEVETEEPKLDVDAEDASSLSICSSCGVIVDNPKTCSNDLLCSECAELDSKESAELIKATLSNKESSNNNVILQQDPKASGNLENKPEKCLSCGSDSLSMDSVNGDERLVCTGCGTVCSNSILTTDATYNSENMSSSHSKYHKATLPRFAEGQYKLQAGLISGFRKISNLCSKFYFSSSVKSEAEEMYRKVYKHPKVLHTSCGRKEFLAAGCLFIVCRQHDLPITLTHFKAEVVNFKRFVSARKFVLSILGINLPHSSMAGQIAELVQFLKFNQDLSNKVKDIVFLFRRAWLTQGRSRKSLITIAAYYAFVSSDKCKSFVTKQNFCKQFKLGIFSLNLWQDCEKFLFKLAASLPWVPSKRITARTLSLYINSILQYQESLFHLVFKSEEDNCNHVQTQTSESQLISYDNVDSDNILETKPQLFTPEKEMLLPPASKKIKIEPSFYEEDEFTPISSNVNLDSPSVKEEEFEEEEINSYILSDEEQERMRNEKLRIIGIPKLEI